MLKYRNFFTDIIIYNSDKLLIRTIDKFQINEINVDLRTSGFDNEVLSVDACAV